LYVIGRLAASWCRGVAWHGRGGRGVFGHVAPSSIIGAGPAMAGSAAECNLPSSVGARGTTRRPACYAASESAGQSGFHVPSAGAFQLFAPSGRAPGKQDVAAPTGCSRLVPPRLRGRSWRPGQAQACLVSQKILAISSIFASSSSAVATSGEPLVPPAPASLVASLNSWWSCGYFSKCGGLK